MNHNVRFLLKNKKIRTSLAGMTLTPPTVSRAPGVTLDQQLLDGGAGPLDDLHFLPRQLCELDP